VLIEHYLGRGDIVYQHVCKLGGEGIVSKRLGPLYCRKACSRRAPSSVAESPPSTLTLDREPILLVSGRILRHEVENRATTKNAAGVGCHDEHIGLTFPRAVAVIVAPVTFVPGLGLLIAASR
jgi:hypothetical protein